MELVDLFDLVSSPNFNLDDKSVFLRTDCPDDISGAPIKILVSNSLLDPKFCFSPLRNNVEFSILSPFIS